MIIDTAHIRRIARYKVRNGVEQPIKVKHVLCGLTIALGVLIVGHAQHSDMVTAMIEDMQSTCEYSNQVSDQQAEKQCGQLIDSVQAQGFEVISDQGHFTAEAK